MDEREEESVDKDKDKPIKIIPDGGPGHDKTDSNKLLSPKGSGELQNGGSRSGANSPSPSDGEHACSECTARNYVYMYM